MSYGPPSYLDISCSSPYAIGFVGNIIVARSIDREVAAPLGQSVVVTVLLLRSTAVQTAFTTGKYYRREALPLNSAA